MPKASVDEARKVAADINAVFGEGTMVMASDMGPTKRWSTGILPIDVMLDGGLPVGRFVEVYGDYSTLKSYMGYKAIAEVQKAGGRAALVDTEHAFEADWAIELGVDVSALPVQRPEYGEQAIATMELLIRQGYDFIMWDSIAATQTMQYWEKLPGEDTQPGSQARMMSTGLRRLTSANKHTTVLCINQTRDNIGVMFGSKVSVPGGKALPFYASFRLSMLKAGRVKDKVDIWKEGKLQKVDRTVKQRIKAQLVKSKLNRPEQEVWFDFDLRTGEVDELAYIIGWAIEHGYIETYGNGGYKLETDDGEIKAIGLQRFTDKLVEEGELVGWFRQEMTEGFLMASPGPVLQSAPAKKKGGGRSGGSSESEG